MSDSKKKLPENRFVIRPKNADPNDEAAVNELAGDVAHWIVAQRDRIQKRNAEEKARREKAGDEARISGASSSCVPMAAKGRE